VRINGNDIVIDPGAFFGHMAYVLFGLFLILLGAAIFYTIAQWARRGRRIEGEVLGVRRRNAQFHSVYRYALPLGGWGEATSVQGSGSLDGRATGIRKLIRVMPDHPEEAREPASPVMWLLAFGLTLGGGWLTWSSVTTWKHSIFTWIFFVLVAALAGRILWPRLMRLLKAVQAAVGPAQPWSALPIESAEMLGSSPAASRAQFSSRRPGRVGPLFCIAGVVVLATAYIPIHKLRELRSGTRAEGTVLWLEMSQFNNNRHNKFPEVQFTAADGSTVRFLDHTGADPSPFRVGDRVTVLYQPGKQGTAMIDYGLRNWEPVVALLVLGTILLSLGVMTLRGAVVVSQSRSARRFSS
jgi:Protein of unknown function (DUF3592)